MRRPSAPWASDTGMAAVWTGMRLAFAWFQKAALQGYADGQSKLGAMYFAGRGVARNEG